MSKFLKTAAALVLVATAAGIWIVQAKANQEESFRQTVIPAIEQHLSEHVYRESPKISWSGDVQTQRHDLAPNEYFRPSSSKTLYSLGQIADDIRIVARAKYLRGEDAPSTISFEIQYLEEDPTAGNLDLTQEVFTGLGFKPGIAKQLRANIGKGPSSGAGTEKHQARVTIGQASYTAATNIYGRFLNLDVEFPYVAP
jgi:hypothetical protein